MQSENSSDGSFAESEDVNFPVPEASTSLVHELILDRAEANPNAEAVVSWDGVLSYHELDAASTRLAGYLAAQGVKAESIVPLLFEKSRWAVVGMLATMKAGGAFMTLDISQPELRLRSIIAQSGAKVALSSASCNGLCSSLVPGAFSVTEQTIADLDERNGPWSVGLGNAAYVMATSGSTGTPKLVVTEHSQLASFVAHLTQPLGFTEQTRAFQFASYAFDPIIGDIFLTLAAGGTVCIPSEDQRKSDVVGAMNSMRVNLAKFTPSLVNALSDLTPTNVPTLRTLILGGETTPAAVLQEWAGKVDLKLIYGSTECTISCVVVEAVNTVVPGEIGRTYGSRARVVNPASSSSDLELVTRGKVGELVVEGPLVARGYMNAPRESETKFIQRRTHRMYRTGDLVRSMEDGRLVYVGRVDNQVKIHAQRLELEEVEGHILQALAFSDIRTKSVLVDAAVPLGSTSKQLVAVLSLDTIDPVGSLLCDSEKGHTTISISPATVNNFAKVVSRLQAKLKSMVPSYMVPSLWLPIDEMPYTLSQKRDRQRLRRAIESLPAKWLAAFSQTDGYLPNAEETTSVITTEKEKLLQRFWSDVLSLNPESIRPRDNFFHLGGNSLLVMRLISMARREGQSLVADDVFAHPVLQDLASKLVTAERSVDLAPFSLLEPTRSLAIKQEAAQQCGVNLDNIEDILPLYSMQEYYIYSYPELSRDSAGPWDWQQQIVFRVPNSLDIPLFKSIWTDAINRHPQLRTRIVRTSHGVFQAALRPEVAPTWQDIDDLDDYVRQDREKVMSFGDELLRLAITTSSTERKCFVLSMQHLIYDAYSRDMLFRELEAAYLHRYCPDTEPPKMNKFISYINGADRQLASEFWTSYLEGSETKPLLLAPIGSPVSELKTQSWNVKKPHLPRFDYTLATAIEVSVALAIAKILDCKDIIFYSDRAGRNLPVPGIQDLMAPTTLFLPLRIHIDQQQTVHDLLSSHQAATTAMIPYEYLEFTELRKMDHIKAILGHALNININPYTPLDKVGAGMGLTVADEYESWADPFAVMVSVQEDELEFAIYFDENFVPETVVNDLVRNTKEVFGLVSTIQLTPQVSVGDVLEKLNSTGNTN